MRRNSSGVSELGQRLVDVLMHGRSAGTITPSNRIRGKALAGALGGDCSEKRVCHLVHDLRRSGYPIASGPAGYYFAVTPEELRDTVIDLRGRSDAMRAAIDGLTRAILMMDDQPTLFNAEM